MRHLPRSRVFLTLRSWRRNLKSSILHTLMQRRHDVEPFAVVHFVPAGDFGQGTSAAKAELARGIDEADGDARRFLFHEWY